MIVSDSDASRALKYLEETELQHAQAKANVKELEKHEKALIASIKANSSKKTATEREEEAYSSSEYDVWKSGYKVAIEELTLLENKRDRAHTVIEVWRTCSASARRI